MKSILLIISLALFLMGCSSTPKTQEVIVEKTKHIVVVPSPELTRDCSVPAPADKDTYLKSTDKEKLLTDNIIDLYGSLAECNKQWSGLRIWFDKQKQNFEKP